MKTFFVFLISIYVSICSAQLQYKSIHFTTDDGLPCNSVYSICEDTNGNLVLGTDNGLSVFNGTSFTNYNVKDGLVNPYIVGVCIDTSGTIWIVNYNGNLQKFKQNKIINTNVVTGYNNQIFFLKNDLFVFTMQNRNANKTFQFMKINRKTLENQKSIQTKTLNRIAPPILFQNNEKIQIVDENLIYKNYKIPISKDIKFIHKVIFRKNDVCILEENYLFFIDFRGKILDKIKLPRPLSENPIFKYDFILDFQGNCWLNLQGKGIFILKNNTWNSINESLGLNSSDNTNYLYLDKKGQIWIATNENGLFCIPSALVSSIRFENKENYFNGFALSKDAKSLFISSKFSLFCYQNKVVKLLQKSKFEVRIGNFDQTPILYNPLNSELKWNDQLHLLNVSGKQIIKKQNNKYFVFAGNSAIHVLENGKSEFKTLTSKNPETEKIKQIVRYKNEFYFNNGKKISIRNFDNDFIYNRRNLKFNPNGYIEDFAFVNDTMWVAVNNIVYKILNEKIIDSITQINETKIDNIHKIKQIGNDVFLCAGNGLFEISKNKNRVLNKYNFLPSNEVYNVELFENQLFVATKDGLAKLDFELISQKTEKPKTTFFYNDFKTNKLKQIESKITIPVQQKSINLFLKTQNFNALKNLTIQYKIDESNWSTLENKTIDFETVSFGNHIILVQSKDINSNWENQKISIYREYPFFLKWWFVLVFAIFVWLICKIIIENLEKNKFRKQQIIIDRKNKIIELRHSALSAMMNPHFIFNSLNAVQYFVNTNQKEQSSEHLAKLARLVRLFLSQASEPFISIFDEISRLKLYLELEQVRFNNFQFSINIDSNIDSHRIKIPNMIVQPFIENAILHGVSHLKTNDGKIDLNFTLQDKLLTIEVNDNGYGIDTTKSNSEKTHISKGIAIISERIEILQKLHPQKLFSLHQQSAFPDITRKGHKVIILVSILD
jgi:Histidine kinase/Two component regulator propeller